MASLQRLKESFRRFVGRAGSHDLRMHANIVAAAAALETDIHDLSDAELVSKVTALRVHRSLSGAALAEFCALGREAAQRTLGERPFDVQLQGVAALLSGCVVEMATGEGKTLAGALAASGFVLTGRGVHVLSVNDYLAERDAAWMGPLYGKLGVTVASVTQHSTPAERREAYRADVTYVSVSEVGFDLLRDRLATEADARLQPEPDVALIDEADAVLIDEARVPLVLAAGVRPGNDPAGAARAVRELSERDFDTDETGLAVHLSNAGLVRVEELLGVDDLYAVDQVELFTQVNLALHARALLHRDVDYIVADGRVRLVDGNRGRVAQLQRWPDGLQAAVEAKEELEASDHGQILDSIIVQKLISGYRTICGMTGTAVVVAEPLREFYELETGQIPTNRPCVRSDEPDRIYETLENKEKAIVQLIVDTHESGRPVLVGTGDIAESERMSECLRAAGIEAVVLNAKNDAEEARIIAGAGAHGAVTVSTQMAGRGTDIRLGGVSGDGHDRVAELGGLLVIGTSRDRTRRLDDQLRGRAGRQGDPGGSIFFASLEDPQVARQADDLPPYLPADGDGRIGDARIQRHVDHAQQVAESTALDIHRTTWRYNQQLQAQRDGALAYRDRLLNSDLASTELSIACPKRWAELSESVPEETLARSAQLIMLFHLDQLWSDHLAVMADVREGIHLRTLGRENPLYAFHREGDLAFRGFNDRVREHAAEAFEKAVITADGLDQAGTGIERPSSTWTYLVHDNPFGSVEDHFVQAIGRVVRNVARR